VLSDVELQPVFWGTGWKKATEPFTVSDFVGQLRTMVSTPYLTGLAEYGCTGTVTVHDPLIWDDDAIAPTKTDVARASTIGDRLLSLIDNGELPEPDEAAPGLVYALVLTSASVLPVPVVNSKPPQTIVGENLRAIWADASEWLVGDYDTDQAVHWFWVGVYPGNNGLYTSLQYSTKVASHELVEKMTDPGPDDGVRNQVTPFDQIGDPNACNQSAAVVDGVAVQPYWSQQAAQGAGAPVLPCRVRNAFPLVLLDQATSEKGPHQEAEQTVLCPIPRKMTIGFTIDQVTQTFRVVANPTGFDNPTTTFSLFGAQLTAAAGTVSGTVSVTPPGGGATANTKVTVTFTINGGTLTVTNDSFDGTFDLPVGIDVTERNLDSIPVPVHAIATAVIPFATRVRTLDAGSQSALEQCTKERARISAGALQQEAGNFPKPDGDPGPKIEHIQQLYAELLDARIERRTLRQARGPAFAPVNTPGPEATGPASG
jgi:hypothetical protein